MPPGAWKPRQDFRAGTNGCVATMKRLLCCQGVGKLSWDLRLCCLQAPGGLALEWQRAVARSGNMIAGLRSALTWTCLVFFSRVCGVRVVCCGVAVDVVCSSRVPASLDAVPPRRVVIAAEWHMRLLHLNMRRSQL